MYYNVNIQKKDDTKQLLITKRSLILLFTKIKTIYLFVN